MESLNIQEIQQQINEGEKMLAKLISLQSSIMKKIIELAAIQAKYNFTTQIANPKDYNSMFDFVIERIYEYTFNKYSIGKSELKSKSRLRQIVILRQLIAYCIMESDRNKKFKFVTLKQLGLELGGRDHSTMIHSIAEIQDKLDIKEKDVVVMLKEMNQVFDRAVSDYIETMINEKEEDEIEEV